MERNPERLASIAVAIMALTRARNCLVKADCPRAADKVRKALKSAEGAYRNAGGQPTAREYEARLGGNHAA